MMAEGRENEHLAEADKGTLQLGVSWPCNAVCWEGTHPSLHRVLLS